MSRDISQALAVHLEQETMTLAFLWRIIRQDGVILGLTSHDRDIEKDGLIYRSAPSFAPSALSVSRDFDANNLELSGALSSSAITEADLAEGRYDFARVEIALINWADVGSGEIALTSGALGDIRRQDEAFTAELRSPAEKLAAIVTEVYSPECRADFGDHRCRVDLGQYTHVSPIVAVASAYRFEIANPNPQENWYAYGRLRWVTGLNAGLEAEIASSSGTSVLLTAAPVYPAQAGDLVDLRAGCDRRFETCRLKFSNQKNFRGEPFVPGADSVLKYPGL